MKRTYEIVIKVTLDDADSEIRVRDRMYLTVLVKKLRQVAEAWLHGGVLGETEVRLLDGVEEVAALHCALAGERTQISVLRDALLEYGWHLDTCPATMTNHPEVCTCGFSKALLDPLLTTVDTGKPLDCSNLLTRSATAAQPAERGDCGCKSYRVSQSLAPLSQK